MAALKSKKSTVVFNLMFTTSRLLAYLIVAIASLVGYLLKSPEIVTIGFIIGGTLSGAKSVSDNLLKVKAGEPPKLECSDEILDSESENKNKRDILL